MKRINKPHDYRRPTLVVCEGELETYYFKQLEKQYRQRPDAKADKSFKIICNGGKGPESIVKNGIKEARGGYRTVWCVMDVETQNNSDNLKNAVDLAKKKGIRLAITNPCFDWWALAHFGAIPAGIGSDPDSYKRALGEAVGGRFSQRDGFAFVDAIIGDGCCNVQRAKNNITCLAAERARSCVLSANMHKLIKLFL